MVLDSLGLENLNIKDLSFEKMEQKPKFHFNPEKELDKGYIFSILEQIEVDRGHSEFYRNANRYDQPHYNIARNGVIELVCLKTLLPEKVDQFLIEDETYKFLSDLKNYSESSLIPDPDYVHNYDFKDQIAYWRLLYSEQVMATEEYQRLESEDENHLRDARSGVIRKLFSAAYYSKLLMFNVPNGIITEEDWQKQLAEIKEEKANKNWDYLIVDLAHFKVIDPERFTQIKITDEDWQEMLIFRSLIREPYLEYRTSARELKIALELAIIAADEVIIDEKGLHLINKLPDQSFQESTPPIPETRNF